MPRIASDTDMRTIDARVAELAARQGGAIGYHQLISAGLRRSTIAARAARGRYVRLRARVYAIGTRTLSRRGELFAVLLAAPRGTRLTGRTVLELRGIAVPGRDRIDVVVDHHWHAPAHVRAHESTTLRRIDHERLDGIPVTTVARALLDLASDLDADQLGKVLHEAEYRKQLDVRRIEDVLAHNPAHPGRGRLAEAMRRRGEGEAGTWSEVERRGHALLARADPERARRNVLLPIEHGEPIRVDAYYASCRLVIEFDPDHHLRPRTRRSDADRNVLLDASGYHRVHLTGHEIEHEPEQVIARVRAALARLRRSVQ